VQILWHSQNTASIMVHDQAFRMLSCHPHQESITLSAAHMGIR